MTRKIATFFLKTYGCQMNELDSEVMVGLLKRRGLVQSFDESSADMLIFNTCSVRDLAERKVMGKLGMLCRSRTDRPIIGITGCMASSKKASLFSKLPYLDFVLGTNNIGDLNAVLDDVLGGKEHSIAADDVFHDDVDFRLASREDKVKAYVSIIRGCNNFCSYCIVPYTRGREVSRPIEDIITECTHLASEGYKEITLLGQNVNSYGKDQASWNIRFHDLLYSLEKIPGIERIRFMTSHPKDITRELMEAVRDIPKLCEFIHFPIQAGSNRVLKKMNRKYTAEEYLEKIAMFREIVPNVALGTDIIVGFPTETDEEFMMTYDVMEKVRYDMAFLFAYSTRKGTAAERWDDDIVREVKDERLQKLIALQNDICSQQRQKILGDTVEVLVEEVNFRDATMLKGRTRCWKNTLFPGDKSLIGSVQDVKVHSYHHQTLLGEMCEARDPFDL
ncbi:MAG: tRNA (N6-isopentenyl adenosine(37)-C2)-methylthiotransferase MiaB [Waddliaceae bacterium]|nr:tRNA (N6-isopentenyl adenosine(37)-C2)-methylthiotransferase MiaB [Waddliaceae bacterium]MBT7264790.1 tRNA (N6-isopentenyl adenosine(37)-C2)-methylthiotransferase MiaB [Waddliaceae bacterium]